jgi:hypothetical protein
MLKSFLMIIPLIIVLLFISKHQIVIRARAAETILTGYQHSGAGEVVAIR